MGNNDITTENKDLILNYICENTRAETHQGQIDIAICKDVFKIDFYSVWAILNYLNDNGYIQIVTPSHHFITFYLKVAGVDLKNHGGFEAKEKIIGLKMEQLILEVDSLKNTDLDKANKISSIISGLATGLSFIFGK